MSNRKQDIGTNICLIAIISFFLIFFIYPLFLSAKGGFLDKNRITVYWFTRVVTNHALLEQLANGLILAFWTTLLATVISLPLALINARFKFKGQSLLNGLVLVPLILPPFVGALSIKHFFGQFGVVNLLLEKCGIINLATGLPPDWLGSGLIAVIILLALHLFPIMYLNITAAIANVDPSLIHAARNLGAGRITTFFRIVLPLIRPGLFAGASLISVWAFTDIGTPLIVGYENLAPVTIFKELMRADTSPRTYSLVLIILFVSVLIYTTGKLSLGKALIADSAKGTTSSEPRKAGPVQIALVWALFGIIILISVLPHIGVLMLALSERWVTTIVPETFTLRHLSFILRLPETRDSILNSFRYAGVATLIDVLVGFAAAWIIVRRKSLSASMLDVLVMLPLAIPGLILAAGFVAMTVPGSWFEAVSPMRNPFLILVIAYSIRRLPFVVRGICAGLEQIPPSLEQAARNLGAAPLQAILRITLPLVAANLIAATILVFSFAMIEVSDSLVLAQLQTHFPITKEIYHLATAGGADAQNMAAALGLVGMLILGSALAVSAILMGKKLGSIFGM